MTLDQAMAAFSPALPLAVGYSAGADSTALLLACARKWPGRVRAIHVHHGLQGAADTFVRHCEATCASLGLSLAVRRVDARHARGESPEEAARNARYAAFRSVLNDDPGWGTTRTIVLAQHADDQVETVLLALSRGAGLAGLAAMPGAWVRDGVAYARPLLHVPGSEILAWLEQHGARFVLDPSNANPQFTRNRIRAQVIPVLERAFPQFRETFGRSAAHAAQTQALLDEVAAQDLAQSGDPPAIAGLRAVSRPRRANLLRHWLKTRHRAVPSSAQLTELLDQIEACSTRGHDIHIKVAQGFVKRDGAVLSWYNP